MNIIIKIRWLLLHHIKMMMKYIYKQQDLFSKLSEDQKHNQREYIRVMASWRSVDPLYRAMQTCCWPGWMKIMGLIVNLLNLEIEKTRSDLRLDNVASALV